jgi:hypothetical protein
MQIGGIEEGSIKTLAREGEEERKRGNERSEEKT